MATSTLATHDARHAAANAAEIAAALQALTERVESIAAFADALRPLAELARQAPALAAILGDSFDEAMRTARERGIDVERGLVNGAEAALRFGASMDAAKVTELEALLQSGVLDPAALRVIGGLGQALVDTALAPQPPAGVGLRGLVRALGNPDVRRALGFLVVFAERFGSRLREPLPERE